MPVTSGVVSPTVITSSETQVIQNTHKVLIAGDSLLHRMNASKMKVCDTPSVRLTKKGDSLAGMVARVKDYLPLQFTAIYHCPFLLGKFGRRFVSENVPLRCCYVMKG